MTLEQLLRNTPVDQPDQPDHFDLGDRPTIDGSIDRLVDVADGLAIRAADPAVPDLPSGSGTAAALEGPLWAGPRVVQLGPEAVATAWMSALLVRRDWTTLWSVTDPNLRLAGAQQWLDRLGSTGDNVTAWSLASEIPHVGMWAAFATQLFGAWRSALPAGIPLVTGRHQVGRATGSDVGRELCVVTLGDGRVDEPEPPTRHLTLRLRDRWRIAGIGAGVAQPGWPARWQELPPSIEGRP